MQTLTHRDVTVPRLGIGTWELTDGVAYDSVRAALEVGYRHVDTAHVYDNEEEVGRAIADSGLDRDELFVTTKVRMENAAPADVEQSTGASLRRLGLDHVDLLLIHWPSEIAPIEATVEALADQQTAAQDLELSDEQVARLDDLPKDQRQLDPPFAPDWD